MKFYNDSENMYHTLFSIVGQFY